MPSTETLPEVPSLTENNPILEYRVLYDELCGGWWIPTSGRVYNTFREVEANAEALKKQTWRIASVTIEVRRRPDGPPHEWLRPWDLEQRLGRGGQ